MTDREFRGMTVKGVAAQHTESVTQSSKPKLTVIPKLAHTWCDWETIVTTSRVVLVYLIANPIHELVAEGGHKSVLSQA